LQRLGLIVVGLVAGLFLGEAVLGWLAPQVYQRPAVWRYDADLGWAHIAGASGRQVSPEFSVEYRINTAGQRDNEFPAPEIQSGPRILVFGDSFAEGWGVELDQRVSQRLALEMPSVQVLNFGVAGYGTDQALLLFERKGKSYRPQHILLLFYANDLWNNVSHKGIGAERGFKPYFALAAGGLRLKGVPVPKTRFWDEDFWSSRPWTARADRYLRQYWHLYALGAKALAPQMARPQQQQFYQGLYGRDDEVRWRPVWDRTGAILAAFKASADAVGARLTLVYVPAIVQVEAENWQTKRQLNGLVGNYDLEKPNRELASFAKRFAMDFVDLSPAFLDAAAQETLYFRDSHWNPAGHALAAHLLAQHLAGQVKAEIGTGHLDAGQTALPAQ
jgi:lysophospholipase L1-like esterase